MKKVLALALSLSLILAIGIAGTLAWLTSTPEAITNTFTIGNVGITLAETTGTGDLTNRTYKVSPGTDVTKDPKVTVTAGSEPCYVFVKVEKSTGFDTYFTYAIATGWTALDGNPGVYYRTYTTTDANATTDGYQILTDNKVTVKDDVTVFASDPTLKFTAYAIQSAGFDDAAAAFAEF